ncbi:MAG TPA: PqqD family peptide modification chaperone [Thermoleophilia bacterium]|nr:PqqD family peptide modification chaperone [Thermoleophilia bacterium]
MSPVVRTDRVAPGPVVVLREEFDDWALLYDADTGRVAGLNPTGVAVWKLLDGVRTVADVAAAVTAGYADVPVDAADEVAALLESLVGEGFAAIVPDE